jgi:hypothetical protein
MKKFFSWFLLATFLGVFAVGCGGPVNRSATPTPEPTEHEAEAEHEADKAEHAAR